MTSSFEGNSQLRRLSLRDRVWSGALWTSAQSWGVQLMGFAIFLALARLLEPSAFGLIALAGVYVHFSSVFVDQGLTTAIVQREVLEPEHIDAAFWMSVAASLILVVCGVLASRWIARLFSEPDLALVIALLSLNFFFTALSGVQESLLRRGFRFKLLAVRSLISVGAGGLVGIVMATKGFGVMALVGQQLTVGATGVLLLWTVSPWRPRFALSFSHARALLCFSGNVLGIRLLNFAGKRSDDLFIGLYLGSVLLGYYVVAYKIFKVLLDLFGKVFTKVAVPAFASIQKDVARVRAAFYESAGLIALTGFPVFGFLAIMAGDVVPLAFGNQWAQSVPVMQVLAVLGLVQVFYLLSHQMIIALGRPSLTLMLMSLNTVLSVVGFLLVTRYGILAVALVCALVAYALVPFQVVVLRGLIGFEVGAFLRCIRGPLVGTIIMCIVVGGIRFLLPESWPVLGVVGTCFGMAACCYLISVAIVQPQVLSWTWNRVSGVTARGMIPSTD